MIKIKNCIECGKEFKVGDKSLCCSKECKKIC